MDETETETEMNEWTILQSPGRKRDENFRENRVFCGHNFDTYETNFSILSLFLHPSRSLLLHINKLDFYERFFFIYPEFCGSVPYLACYLIVSPGDKAVS